MTAAAMVVRSYKVKKAKRNFNEKLAKYVAKSFYASARYSRTAKIVITRKLSYRKDDRAMRHMYGCPENFRETLTMPTATFPEIFNGLLVRLSL